MTNQRRNLTCLARLARLAPFVAAAALLGTACGSTTTESSGTIPPVEVTTPSTVVEPADSTPPPTTEDTTPATTEPATGDTTPTTDSGDEPAAPVPLAAPCGTFGDIPLRPDSMPTKSFDTNGDGTHDDATAYAGGGHGWVLRVVEDGVTSEASLVPDPVGWAFISGTVEVDGRERVMVQDNETGAVHTFATNSSGCVELISTGVSTACGSFDPIPAGYPVLSDLSVDLLRDGTANDRVIAYLDESADVYMLRSVRNGVTSEIAVPDVGVSSPRILGVGNTAQISPGNEVIVRTGGGASSAKIGMYGHSDDGCISEFTLNGTPFAMFVGGTIGYSSGMFCSDGLVANWEYQLESDGTYTGSSAAYFESSAGNFTYLPASDDYSDGLSVEDLSPATLDCFGFGL